MILSVTIFMASVSWNQVAPYLPRFLQEMGLRGPSLHDWSGATFALPAIAAIILQPYWIKLGDRYGRKPMIVRAGICLASIYFLMSICRHPWQLVICRFLNGALTGFIPGSIALIATNTPQDEAPRSLAIAQSANAIGQIAGPSIGLALAIAAGGYRPSMRISGCAAVLSTILVGILVQEPNKMEITEQTSMIQDVGTAFRSPLIRALMLPVMMEAAFASAVISQLALHLPHLTGDPPVWFQGIIYSGPALAMAGTAYLWSRLGERFGYARMMQVGLVGTCVFSMALTFVTSAWLFLPTYFCAGTFLASIFPSMGALLCTQVDDQFRARAYGVLAASASLGAFIAPFFAARVAASFGTAYVFTLMGVVFMAGAVAYPIMIRKSIPQSTSDAKNSLKEATP
jgi:MFS family permease